MHALIASGGHDPEFLTDDQLGRVAAAPAGRASTSTWYATLPASMRDAIEERWGPPPGERYLDGDDFVIAGLELGNVLVAIQPPRGYGEDPVGIYHDPELPPTHHYLACYRWIDASWGADAIVHLGKHGTLEWLPGKMLALSAECAPDAALGDMPLIYPFVVNDPGEGVQAKRRAHAVIVDHLVPPMMRADTYDELAELEALLDEYARLEVLDPPKLPALAARIWAGIEQANLQSDLGVSERPDDLGALVEHIDGYLCEVKDIQIKDGLHVLGVAPSGDQLRGLTAAMLRLGSGDVPGLRRAVGAAFGLDEPALVAAPAPAAAAAASSPEGCGEKATPGVVKSPDPLAAEGVRALVERFRGPGATAGDLVDRLEAAQMALLDALAARGWDPAAATEVCAEVLGRADAGVERVLRFAASEVVPRIRRTPDELDAHRRRAGRAPRAGRPVGRADARSARRPADRAQLLLRRPARAAVGAVLRGRVQARRRAPRPPHRRHRRAAADGRPRRVGHRGDAHPGRRRRRDPRAARRPADVAPRVATGHRASRSSRWTSSAARGSTSRSASRASSATRSRTSSRCSTTRSRGWPHSMSRRTGTSSRRTRAPTPSASRPSSAREPAWRRATTRVFGSKPGTYGAGLLQLLDARDWRDDADLAAVYEAWGGYAYGRGLDGAPGGRARCATATRGSTSRSRTSTPASTTSSTPTTTTSTTAA